MVLIQVEISVQLAFELFMKERRPCCRDLLLYRNSTNRLLCLRGWAVRLALHGQLGKFDILPTYVIKKWRQVKIDLLSGYPGLFC